MIYLPEYIRAYRILRTGRNEKDGPQRFKRTKGRWSAFLGMFRMAKELSRQRLVVDIVMRNVDDRGQLRESFLRRMGIK